MERLSRTWRTLLGGAALLLAVGPAHAQAPAGVTAAVNPQATGTPPSLPTQVLEVGSDVVRNEHLATGPEGQAQLLFRDGSTMTLGPGADLTIDTFVFDPEARTAKLAMTAATGVFRFVGGRASKDEPVVITTPTATVGIRGGMALFNVGRGTDVTLLFGKSLTVTSTSTHQTFTISKLGFMVSVLANQAITAHRADQASLIAAFNALRGRADANGGATTTPNENSTQAQLIATSNSGQALFGNPGSVTFNNNTLGFVTSLTNQLVTQTAQTIATGSTTPQLTSGSYAWGLAGSVLGAESLSPGYGPQIAFAPYSYSFTGGSASLDTGVTLAAGIPQSFTLATSSSFNGSSFSSGVTIGITGATVTELGGDSLIQFGRLVGGTATYSSVVNGASDSVSIALCGTCSTHYAFGVPPTMLPMTGTFTYSLLGATSPTFADGSGSPGSFTGGLSIMFGVNSSPGSLQVGFDGTVSIEGVTYHMLTAGGLNNISQQLSLMSGAPGAIGGSFGQFSGNPMVTISQMSRACPSASTCGASVIGFLAGPGGIRAGILYSVGNNIGTSATVNLAQVITGAAIFRR